MSKDPNRFYSLRVGLAMAVSSAFAFCCLKHLAIEQKDLEGWPGRLPRFS